jgi:hypothetical protein
MYSPLESAWRSGAVLVGRDLLEARIRFDAASQIPECAADPPSGIRYQNGRRYREKRKMRSSTHKPEATALDLWMTKPAHNPECQLERSRIEYGQARLAPPHQVCPRHNNCRLQDSLEILFLLRFHKSTSRSTTRSTSGPFCV